MLYVPFIPPHDKPPSPRVRELTDLLGRVIEEYEKHHPAVTGPEVRAAARMAVERSSRKGSPDLRIALGVAVALVLGGLFVLLAFVLLAMNQGGMPQTAVPVVAITLVILAVLLAVALARRSGR